MSDAKKPPGWKTTRREVLQGGAALAQSMGLKNSPLATIIQAGTPADLAQTRLTILTIWKELGRLKGVKGAQDEMRNALQRGFEVFKSYETNTPIREQTPQEREKTLLGSAISRPAQTVEKILKLSRAINDGVIPFERETLLSELNQAIRSDSLFVSSPLVSDATNIKAMMQSIVEQSAQMDNELREALQMLKRSPHVTEAVRQLMRDYPGLLEVPEGYSPFDIARAIKDLDSPSLFSLPDPQQVRLSLSESYGRITGEFLPGTPDSVKAKLHRIWEESPEPPFSQTQERQLLQEELEEADIEIHREIVPVQAVPDQDDETHPLPVARYECWTIISSYFGVLSDLQDQVKHYGLSNLPDDAAIEPTEIIYNPTERMYTLRIYAPSHRLKEMLKPLEKSSPETNRT